MPAPQNEISKITDKLATELNIKPAQVASTISLLDEGSTVPFISRYRKEATGGLDDGQLRMLEERLGYLREMEERRQSILKSIEEQGKLSEPLKKQILEADSKTRLEDLYLPYKKKRRTKGQMAIEAGIEPLADALYQNPELTPEVEAENYINEQAGYKDIKAVLEGAQFILMERFAENADMLAEVRELMYDRAIVKSVEQSIPPKDENPEQAKNREQAAAKFSDYFDFQEAYNKVPSHRALALLRGRKESHLSVNIVVEHEEGTLHPAELIISKHAKIEHHGRPADDWLKRVVSWTSKIKVLTSLELELMTSLREKAEEEAISVFANNLKDLLLAAPAGAKVTMGLDPGFRTGTKVAVVDATGKLVDHATIYPHPPQKQWDESIQTLATLSAKHGVELVSIGNGTASRETGSLASELIKKHPDLKLTKLIISEAGASVYSASERAAKEFPDLDVTIRGAVSIARRLQDPLAELVKIEPKAIGVGQYQHDVNQYRLAKSLEAAVEDCVNNVGVDLNIASAALLSRVSGLNERIAESIVEHRDRNGSFANRDALIDVTGFGAKAFEQSAGFLRIRNGDNALDSSSVHPESYSLVSDIAAKASVDVDELIGNRKTLSQLSPKDFVSEEFGLPTITDIFSELEKPGRDPRPEFKTAKLTEGVEKISDLKPGMILEGTVSNVANFGAFVDLGVHQDGLVHISAMSKEFIDDPRKVVKAGDIVKVKVMEVDTHRKRIGLSMRLDDEPGHETAKPKTNQSRGKGDHRNKGQRRNNGGKQEQFKNNQLAKGLADLLNR